jgi:hypothetical protein
VLKKIFEPKDGRSVAQAVGRSLIAKYWFRSQVSPYGICGGQSDISQTTFFRLVAIKT